MSERNGVGWVVDIWDGDGRGFRLIRDAEYDGQADEPDVSDQHSSVEFGLIMTREEAYQHELLDHVTHGDSSARVDVTRLDSESTVYLYGGLANAQHLARWLRRVLVLLEGERG